MSNYPWESFKDAYGSADTVPLYIERVVLDPGDQDAWEELWSRLYHQGDIYDASFIASIALAACIKESSLIATSALSLASSIEYARLQGIGPEVPKEYEDEYYSSLEVYKSLLGENRQKVLSPTEDRISRFAQAVFEGDLIKAKEIEEES